MSEIQRKKCVYVWKDMMRYGRIWGNAGIWEWLPIWQELVMMRGGCMDIHGLRARRKEVRCGEAMTLGLFCIHRYATLVYNPLAIHDAYTYHSGSGDDRIDERIKGE